VMRVGRMQMSGLVVGMVVASRLVGVRTHSAYAQSDLNCL
jgi:hypothetical protein